MICSLPRAQVERFIQYVFVKIHDEKIPNFMDLAQSVYKETSEGNNANALTYLQMLPSVYMTLYTLRQEVRTAVPADQLAVAGPKIDEWASLDNIKKDLGLDQKPIAQDAKMFVDSWKDLSIRAFNRIYQKSPYVVEGLQSDATVSSKNYNKDIKIEVTKFPISNLKTQYIPLLDVNNRPIGDLQFAVQHPEFYVSFKYDGGNMGYIKPLKYYRGGKEITLDELAEIVQINEADLAEMKAAQPLYDALFARLKDALGNQPSVTLSLNEAGVVLTPNFNKFDILSSTEFSTKQRAAASVATTLDSASDLYFNQGKGLIVKAYNGQYLSEVTDDDAPDLPVYRDAQGNPKAFRGYFALVTMPNNKKYWIGIRPTNLDKLGAEEVNSFINNINVARERLKGMLGNSPDNAIIADTIANDLNNAYYTFTNTDYNIFFTSNFNALTNSYVLRADFLLRNMPIGNKVPTFYFDNPVNDVNDLVLRLNTAAKESGLSLEITKDSFRKNIPFDRVSGQFEKLSQDKLGKSFSTTVGPNIFANAFFTFTIKDAVELSQKVEEVEQEEEKPLTPAEVIANLSPEFLEAIKKQALEEQAKAAAFGNGASPFKITTKDGLKPIEASELEELKKMLPSYISVKDLETVVDNLNVKGIPLGYFKDKVIYLASSTEKGVAYHEAFHAIFRTALSNEEVASYIAQGKKALLKANPTALNPVAVQEFKYSRNYLNISDAEVEDIIVEEYLADKFQEYKLNKKESFLSKLYDKLMNFVRWLTNRNTDIESLFYKISSGKFAGATQKLNKFNNLGYGVYDLIPNTSGLSESESIVKTVAARVVEDSGTYAGDMDAILNDMARFYAIENPENRQAIIDGKIDANKLVKKFAIYSDPDTRAIIKSEVGKLLNKLYKYDPNKEEFEDLESEYGRAADAAWDKSIDEFGGFDGVNAQVKRFVLTTTYVTIDPITNRPVRSVIDGEYVYANLERALAGKKPADVISGLQALAKINPQIKAVWDKLKAKTNLVESTPETVGNEHTFTDLDPANYADNLEGKQFMTTFLKALEKNFLNHLQVVVDYSADNNNKSRVFSSNRQDAPEIQMQRWQQGYLGYVYERLYENKELRSEIAEDLRSFVRSYNSGKVTEGDLEKARKALWATGLEFEPAYIRMSFAGKEDQVAASLRKAFPDMIRLNTMFLEKVAEYLTLNRIIFEKGDLTTEKAEDGALVDLGLTSMIKQFVTSNVIFDSRIFQTNFQTADNKTRYSYVYPNYYVNKVNEIRQTLSSVEAINSLKNNMYYKYNHLLNIYSNKELNAQLAAANFGSLFAEITGDIREEETDQEDGSTKMDTGLVFKDTDEKALLITNLSLFANRNTKTVSTLVDGKRSQHKLTFARFWPLQLEAKSTMLSLNLPVLDGISKDGQLTQAGISYLNNYVIQEIARIGILTKPMNERNPDYRIDNKRNEFVYFKFLNNPLVDSILEIKRDAKGNVISRKQKVTPEDIAKVTEEARKGLLEEYRAFVDKVSSNNIMSLIDAKAEKDYGNKANFLSAFFYNHLFNSIGIKQLMFGDESQFKDDVDLVKRAGGLLAFGVSRGERVYTTAYTSEAVEYIYASSMADGNPDTIRVTRNNDESAEEFNNRLKAGLKDGSIIEINTDDAGSEMTAQEFIDIQYDLGRLNPLKLEALNLLKEGIKPNSEEEARYNTIVTTLAKSMGGDSAVSQALAIDAVSMKLVSFGGGFIDGQYTDAHNVYYDKMSVGVLFKNFTSRWDEATQKWVPQKGLEALHNKRVWMEKNGIGQVNPKSAGKLKTGPLMDHRMFRGIVLDEDAPLPNNLVYAPQKRAGKNQRLQVEVESHGTSKITALSQATQLIDTEVSDAMLGLRKEYQETLSEIRQRSFIEAYDLVSKDIIVDNKESRDIKLFLEKVRDIISSTTPSMSMLEYLETEGVDTKYDFNVPSVISKLENVFLAHFNNDTFVQKVPGRTFVLRSSRDYKVIVDSTTGNIVPRDKYVRADDPSLYETDKYEARELRVHKKVGDSIQYAEVVISRGTAALHGLQIGQNIPEELLIAFGVRIPTQSHHSMIPFKVVDFLPDYMGDTIILPKEIVYLSGADFDIDKLFAYMKTFYTKGKSIVPYGTAVSPEDRKAEYEKWELKNNSTLKRLIDNLKENSQLDTLRREKKELEQALSLGPLFSAFDSLVESLVDVKDNKSGAFKDFYDKLDSSIAYIYGSKAESKKQVVKYLGDRIESLAARIAEVEKGAKDEAMKYLKFPTLEDFKKNPNLVSKGALFNKLIDIHIKFATNAEATVEESLRTPATTKLLEQDANLISKLTGKAEGRFIGSSMNGILDSWVNNVQGKRLVGIWANTNIVSASLTKYKTKLNAAYSITFDGVTYSDFAKEREDDVVFDGDTFKVVKDVRRKADTISGGVSAATDNAKERLMARLNYDDDNTGVYGIMSALGMGRTRTNLFASQPVIIEYNRSLKSAQTQIRPSGSKSRALEIKISSLKKAIAEAMSSEKKEVTRQMFDEFAYANITTDRLVAALEGKLTGVDKLIHEYTVLNAFKRMKDVQEYGRKYAKLLSINRGITSNFSYVNDLLEAAEELDLGDLVGKDRLSTRDRLALPFAVRDHIIPAAGKVTDLNIYNNVKNIKSIDAISKKFFIKNTEWFKSTLANIGNSTVNFPGGITGKQFRQYTEKALFNFVVMSTYSKWLKEVKGINIEDFAPLAYNNLKSTTIRDKFTELLKDKEFASNELVRFVQTDKKGILDRIFTNTRLKTTAKTEQRFVDAYDALLNSKNPKVREFAIGLFGYILVKDGGMFGNSSIVKFIKPAMFYNMAAALRGVNKAMYTGDDTLAKQITGYTLSELRGRFYKTFVSDYNTYPYIKRLPKEDILDNTGVVIGEKFASVVQGYSKKGPFDLFFINKGKDSLVIKTAPIRGGGSMGNSEFMHYTVSSQDDVQINPPKALTASADGKRELFLLTKAEVKTDSAGYSVYTYTYKPGTVFGTNSYNPYTLPYDFSVKNFSFGAPVKKADTRAMSIAEVNDLLSQSDIIEDMYTAEPITKTSMENTLSSEEKSVSYNIKTYEGKVTKLKDNEVFVFGSNPEGRHGAGAAKQAMDFGAKYGQGRGPQGKTYGLVTKNLKAGYVEPSTGIKYDFQGERSVPMELIESNIKELYDYADQNPDKNFLVIYSGVGRNLNGYSNEEMARAFSKFPIPVNMVFEKRFSELLNPIIDVKNTTVGEQVISEKDPKDPATVGKETNPVDAKVSSSIGLRGISKSFLLNFPKFDNNALVPETVTLPDFIEEYVQETQGDLSFSELQYLSDYEQDARNFMDIYLRSVAFDGTTMQEAASILRQVPPNALDVIDADSLLGEELHKKFIDYANYDIDNILELFVLKDKVPMTFEEKELVESIIESSKTFSNDSQLNLWSTTDNESETPFDC